MVRKFVIYHPILTYFARDYQLEQLGKSDINITLDTDIDLTGKDWTPIGTDYDNSYKGTFDGAH